MRRILYNAKVYVEKGVFRQAVLIEDDMIKAVGTDEEIKAMATDDTEMMDCGGKTLLSSSPENFLGKIPISVYGFCLFCQKKTQMVCQNKQRL